MSLYSLIKTCWKAVLPQRVRQALFDMSPAPIKRMRRSVIGSLEKGAKHDEIYDADYYASLVDPTMLVSAESIASSIMRQFNPKTAVDVGCGTGVLMQVLMKKGVKCWGYEYSEAAIKTCRGRGLDVTQFDIEKDPIPTGVRTDVVISTEVAEHLPESCADRFLDVLTAISDNVVLTAAQPLSEVSSTDHVNEQPRSYWIEKMRSRGFSYLEGTSDGWRVDWEKAGVAGCFWTSVMVFVKVVQEPGHGARHASHGVRKDSGKGMEKARIGR